MPPLSEPALQALLELGRQWQADGVTLQRALKRVAPFKDEYDHTLWPDWDAITGPMSTDDVLHLFRGAVIADERLDWSFGSAASAIWIFRELGKRDAAIADGAADWALGYSSNPWVPFGSNRLYARTAAAFRRRQEWRADDIKAGLARDAEVTEEAVKWRELARAQRQHAAELRRSDARTRFIEALSELSLPKRLEQLARDQEFPVEWYPVRLARAATEEVLRDLPLEVQQGLFEKFRGSHRGSWGECKRRLFEVIPASLRKSRDKKPWFEPLF
jgi:hypothetical protein